MNQVRALVVGAGTMGLRHAEAIVASGDAVTVVVDANLERAQQLSVGAQVARTLDEALAMREAFDVAVIATPSGLHLEQAATLLGSDCPVLIEKPHRLPGQHTDEFMSALNTSQGYAFVGMSTRHWPGVSAVTQAVHEGELGEVLTYRDRVGFKLAEDDLPGWYFDSGASGGGILLTNGVHALDRACAMLGDITLQDSNLHELDTPGGVDKYAYVAGNAGDTRVSVELLWTPYLPVQTGIVITGTQGNAVIHMDGSWEINSQSHVEQGPAIDIDRTPFVRQWQAFINRDGGFSVQDLEPTLTLIEQVYGGELA